MDKDTPHPAAAVVLYNGACPICAREIAGYRRAAARHDAPLRFEDLDQADLAAWGLSHEAARRRLHLRQDGQVLAGLPAFLALWARLPGWRWLARGLGLPGVRQVAHAVYEGLLAPLLAAMDRRRRLSCRLGRR